MASLKDIVALAREHREVKLATQIQEHVRPVSIAPGRLEMALSGPVPPGFQGELSRGLLAWTGTPWQVHVAKGDFTAPTLKEARRAAVEAHPFFQEAMATFPGATLTDIRPLNPGESE